ncbi:MAG TPA: hypothetical protein VGR00_13385 [Thermoanaerobaculia bacterium]|nr:hypothetical protein [Thermoanaerobaculia bacterium]
MKLVARRIRTAATFEAPDPWNGGRTAPFSVEVYKMLPAHLRDPRDWRDGTIHTMGAPALYGIRSEIDGVERRLPTFLGDLFESASVPPTRLPELLRRAEPELAPKDFKFLPRPWTKKAAGISLTVALAGLLAFLAVSGPALNATLASRPRTGTLEAWASAPLAPGDTWILSGMVPIEARQEIAGPLKVPDSVRRAAGSPWFLAVAKAGAAHRAFLVPARHYERDGAIEIGYAVVKSPRDLGIASDVDRLRARFGDLDTATVTCSRWVAASAPPPAVLGRALSLVAALAGFCGAASFGLAWAASAPRRRRNRELAERLLGERATAGVSPR